MLSQSDNQTLTQVGAGTPMGELLRRYWHPIAAVTEFDEAATKQVRLMGEDLVLYKDLGGAYGLVDRHCPHRGADMSYGFVEHCGIRCNYHGWLFDQSGRCTAQPYEEMADPDSRFKDKVRIKAYPVRAKAGLLWAYLGPDPAPLLPEWEPFTWPNGFVQIVFTPIPCNWFQCQENSIDPVHFEWMHSNWRVRLRHAAGAGSTPDGPTSDGSTPDGPTPYVPTHVKVGFDEFEHGFIYRRITTETDEKDPLWTVGRVCLWPNALFTGGHFEWRVPIDDETTLSVGWFYNRVPKEREPYRQDRIPHWHGPLEETATGRWITSHVMNQDFVAWVGQGVVTDRTREHLGQSDRGVIMMRKRFLDDLKRMAAGEDPKSIIRQEGKNRCIELPIIDVEDFRQGMTLEQVKREGSFSRVSAKRFLFQAGQPEAVRRAYEEAMGFEMEDEGFV